MPGSEYCWAHDPSNAAERKRIATKGGKSGGRGRATNGDIQAIKEELAELLKGAKDGTITTTGWLINAVIGSQMRLIELERKIHETEELEARLDALEQAQELAAKGGKRWG